MTSLGLSLRQLEYFVAAADTGTMTAASDRFHVSQSAVSLGIADLERALGVQLLLRHKAKGLSLTPAGSQLLTDARALLAHAEELQTTAHHLGQQLAGTLTVGCYLTLGPFLVPRILDEFSRAHPTVELDFVEGLLTDLQHRLLDGTIDAALLFDLDILPGIDREVLYETTPHVLLSTTNPLARRRAIRLADLVNQPAITFDVPGSIGYITNLLNQAGVAPVIRHRTTSFELVRSLVARDLGYSLLFQRPASELSYEGRPLATRPIADPIDPMPVVLARRGNLRPTRRVDAFIAYCRQNLTDVSDR